MMTLVKDYAEQIRGVSYKPEDVCEELNDESITLLRANNITDSGLCFDDLVYVRRNKVKDVQKLQKGDVLICTSSGSKALVGKAAYVTKDMDMTFGAFCKVIRPHGVNTDYFQYFFQSPAYRKKISELAAGANINNIRNEHIDGLAFYLPDISTQQRIADTLDKVSEGIGLCRKMLGELDLMVKAKFGEMFGDLSSPECQWEKCHLIEVCANKDDIKCGPFGTQLSKEEYLSEGVAVWEIPQINSQFAKKPTHFLTRQKAEQLSAYSLLPGDIAMSRKGNVGKCAIFPSCFAPGIIHSDVLRIRVDSAKVNPIFMMSQLHYSGAVTRQIEIVSSGAIMAGINVTKLKQIIVHVPPYAIQNRFAAFVTEIDKSKLTIQKILDKMELEKLALMQEYFG